MARKPKVGYVKDFDYSLFELGEVFEEVKRAVPHWNRVITGRCMGAPWDMGVLAEAVCKTGHSDYLEIGSYWGGSLISVGMGKKVNGFSGRLVSIDPYTSTPLDEMFNMYPTARMMKLNLQKFDLEADHYLLPSEAAPKEHLIEKYDFGCVYVDGDHAPAAFQYDLKFAAYFMPEYIVIDNVDTKYPHIYKLMMDYLSALPYRLVHLSGITAVMRRND